MNVPNGVPIPASGPVITQGSFDVDSCLKLYQVAEKLYQSKLFPNVGSPAGAFAVVQLGHEIGLSPMQALNNIDVIKGKLAMNAKTMLALMIRSGIKYEILEISPELCRMRFIRGDMETECSYSIEEAREAGLVKPDSGWAKYPADMLFARCVSRASRRIAPDVIQGLYTPEELLDIQPQVKTHASNTEMSILDVEDNEIEEEINTGEFEVNLEFSPEEENALQAVIHDNYEALRDQNMWDFIKEELNKFAVDPLSGRTRYLEAVKEYLAEKTKERYTRKGEFINPEKWIKNIKEHPMQFADKFILHWVYKQRQEEV